MRQMIVDTETTGLSPEAGHRIIEIACMEMVNRRLTGNRFHEYINPEREVEAGALAVHGITNEFLYNQQKFKDIAQALLDYLKGTELIIHNAPFDTGFLDCEFKQWNGNFTSMAEHCEIFDTLAFARQKHPGQQNNLDALCRRYGVDNSSRKLHGALLDAELLAEVYLRMTGGQSHLFAEEGFDQTVSQNKARTRRIKQDHPPLVIIEATTEELILHQERLQAIKKQAGRCLWIEEH